MANQLDGSKRSNQIYELDSIRYLREEDAADIFGLPYSTVLYFAQAAGAVYQLLYMDVLLHCHGLLHILLCRVQLQLVILHQCSVT